MYLNLACSARFFMSLNLHSCKNLAFGAKSCTEGRGRYQSERRNQITEKTKYSISYNTFQASRPSEKRPRRPFSSPCVDRDLQDGRGKVQQCPRASYIRVVWHVTYKMRADAGSNKISSRYDLFTRAPVVLGGTPPKHRHTPEVLLQMLRAQQVRL